MIYIFLVVTWFSGERGDARLMVPADDLKRLFQPKQFCFMK